MSIIKASYLVDAYEKSELFKVIDSRLTNFVGTLSEGLKIFPPEAPTNDYMAILLLFYFLNCV